MSGSCTGHIGVTIPRVINTQGILSRVSDMGMESFTMLVVQSMKENGKAIRNMGRLVNEYCLLLYVYNNSPNSVNCKVKYNTRLKALCLHVFSLVF